MVYGTAQNGYTLTNGPKCGLSIMKTHINQGLGCISYTKNYIHIFYTTIILYSDDF